MRCSGWSSLVISVCSALVFAAPAGARISIVPAQVQAGDFVQLVVTVPNAYDDRRIDHVTLGIPPDFEVSDAEAKPGWAQSRTGQAITWSGGEIPKGQFATFTVRGIAPAKVETVLFNVFVGDRSGKSNTYQVGLDVVGHGPRDTGARSLGRSALVVAVIAVGLALASLLVAGYAFMRTPP
jgi:uncharacterized protein YcnI